MWDTVTKLAPLQTTRAQNIFKNSERKTEILPLTGAGRLIANLLTEIMGAWRRKNAFNVLEVTAANTEFLERDISFKGKGQRNLLLLTGMSQQQGVDQLSCQELEGLRQWRNGSFRGGRSAAERTEGNSERPAEVCSQPHAGGDEPVALLETAESGKVSMVMWGLQTLWSFLWGTPYT